VNTQYGKQVSPEAFEIIRGNAQIVGNVLSGIAREIGSKNLDFAFAEMRQGHETAGNPELEGTIADMS